MALYSLKKISLLAESRQAYLRGVSGYNAGWVRAVAVDADVYYSRRVTARVEEMGASWNRTWVATSLIPPKLYSIPKSR